MSGKTALIFTIILSIAASGCSLVTMQEVERLPAPAASPKPSPTPVPLKFDAELQAEIAEIALDAKGTVGVAAVILETGEAVTLNPDEQYAMQSVYKVPIAMAVLKQVDEGKTRLLQDVVVSKEDFVRQGFHSPIRNVNPGGTIANIYSLLRYSVSESDGTATDVLLEVVGGPAAVQAYLDSIGIKEMIVANTLKEISRDWETQYRNWAKPMAAVELLRAIHERRALSEATTTLLLELMRNSHFGGDRIKGGLPRGTEVANKTGTGGRNADGITGATNDFGLITMPDGRHIAIAVFVKDSAADGWTREDVISRITEAVWNKWTATGA